MKPEGKRLEHLITDQVSEGHQRTVVICLPFQSLKGPNGRGENFVHVPEGVHIRASCTTTTFRSNKARMCTPSGTWTKFSPRPFGPFKDWKGRLITTVR